MLERRAGGELRAEGRKLSGVLMRYGDVSESHRERFAPGSIVPADVVVLNLEHRQMEAIAWTGGGGLELHPDRDALRMTATLPKIPAGDAALAWIRSGQAKGLSVEFKPLEEERQGDIRVVRNSLLVGAAITSRPSYQQATVEARRRSGRTLKARIPVDVPVECRCSGAECTRARIIREALQEEFERAFTRFEKEVIAGFGSYDMPLASRSAGTLRGRILDSGDGEIEIDLPDDAAGAATTAAHEAAGVIVRPHFDRAVAETKVDGDTRIYTTAPIRAFLVSATDARAGWPPPDMVPTSEELATAGAPRHRRFRPWL